MAQQERAHIFRNGVGHGEKRVAEFVAKIAVDVQLSPARIDQEPPSVVIEEEGDVEIFFRDLLPLAASAFLPILPDDGAIEVRGLPSDWRVQRVGTDGQPVHFYQAKRGAANLRLRSGQKPSTLAQQTKALHKEIASRPEQGE